MYLNVDKCFVVSFHRNRNPITYPYKLNGVQINRKTETKDLGVFIQNDLRFNAHYNYITKKGYRNLGFIQRNTRAFSNPKTFKALYSSIVRSSLEYCTPLWSPSYVTHIEDLEKIQKKFLRSLGFKDPDIQDTHDYRTIMQKYNINTLQHRRDIFDVLLTLKLIRGQLDCSDLVEHLNFRCNSRNTRNHNIFLPKFSRTNISKTAPMNRCMQTCNVISKHPHNIDIFNERMSIIKNKLTILFSLH
uniref:Uncharacterized protein n=1 Tax=Cacopsylla melanoneura TaxID=428564 RepID=A0A8D8W7H9_9HEMI